MLHLNAVNSSLQNLERLHQTFLPTLLDFVKLFYNVFMHEDAPKEETEDHRRHFVEWIKNLFAAYFDIARNLLHESYSAPSAVFHSDSMSLEEKEKEMGHGALDMKSALEIMSSDMSVVHAQIPGASLMDKTAAILRDSIKNFIEENVSLLRASIDTEMNTLGRYKQSVSKDYQIHVRLCF